MSAFNWGVLRMYNSALQRHPLATQIVTAGVLWGAGDLLAQRMEKRRCYDLRRGVLTAAFGAAAVAPFGYSFYHNLDRVAGSLFKPGSAQFVAFKVAADAIIYEPLYVLGYFTLMSLGTGGSWADVQQKVRQDFWPTLIAELTVWPPIQAANFKLVASPNHQMLVVNLITVLDSTFMSLCCATPDWLHAILPAHKGVATQPISA